MYRSPVICMRRPSGAQVFASEPVGLLIAVTRFAALYVIVVVPETLAFVAMLPLPS